ncbi:ABC transporter ATP-binding protein [Candidatus Uabimicrobium amorphum]|uniref:ABC transporter ATP-binding protein n=1 Tax=Uabimicrobium amorphum TaxID=2596890 RepID=A0A5S9IWH7_UABAM|nr:ABC transporter ATP-binding protein [Candidatus Uabimicrobium amorphum]
MQSDRSIRFFVYGPSGVGKTTLVRMLAGLLRPDFGKITVNDEVWFDSEQQIFLPPQQRSISYVSQEYVLFPHMTVIENIQFSNKLSSQEEILRLLKVLKLSDYKHAKPHLLSGGQRQRVAIIRAIIRNSKLLLLDEPFSGQDDAIKRVLRSEIQRIHEKNNTITVFISHDISEGLLHSDYIVLMETNTFSVVKSQRQIFEGMLPVIAEVIAINDDKSVELCANGNVFSFVTQERLSVGERILIPLQPTQTYVKISNITPSTYESLDS